jgi:DNA-binding NarL/FixJ family response regulator
MRTYIADQNAEVRAALGLLVQRRLGFEVVGESARCEGLAERLRAARAELLLVEWELPGQAGRALMASLRALYPGLRMVPLTCDAQAGPDAFAAGADAFVYKGDPVTRTVSAIAAAVSPSSTGT